MANAKKCDRCGTFYEKNERHEKIIGCRKTIIDGIAMTTRSDDTCDYMDLCDECLTKLMSFLSGAELAEDREEGDV